MKCMKWVLLLMVISCCMVGCQNKKNTETENQTETEDPTETEFQEKNEIDSSLGGHISMGGAPNQTGKNEQGQIKDEVEVVVPKDTESTQETTQSGSTDRKTKESEKAVVFANGYPEGFWARNDRGNGGMFNCSFARENAVVENGYLTLTLDKTATGYAGAEYRTNQRCGYGFYSVSMKPVKESGVISSFFIYNGRPWDEIDIEFLGNDTTKVQFNYYTNGVGGHEYLYDLGFDASEEFHEYAFEWKEGSITWYVDGKAVYQATEDIPSHEGNLMMNLWNVADECAYWAGKFEGENFPLTAQYEWIGISSAESTENK